MPNYEEICDDLNVLQHILKKKESRKKTRISKWKKKIDTFKFGKKIGQGSFGKVYRASERSSGTVYACKKKLIKSYSANEADNFLNKSNFVNIKDTFLAFFFLLIHLQFAIAIKL